MFANVGAIDHDPSHPERYVVCALQYLATNEALGRAAAASAAASSRPVIRAAERAVRDATTWRVGWINTCAILWPRKNMK